MIEEIQVFLKQEVAQRYFDGQMVFEINKLPYPG